MSRNLYWTGNLSSNLALAGNWGDSTNNINPAILPPTSTDQVNFTGNPGTITGSGSAASVNFDNGTWVLAGAVINDLGYLNIGFSGISVVDVTSAGTLETTGSNTGVSLGNNTGASGTIDVSGTNSLFLTGTNNFQLGFNGSGLLSVSQNGTASLGSANLGNGYGASGTISVASAGTVNATGGMSIGNINGSTGLVTVDGAGSLLTLNGFTSDGQNGSGTISVSNNGVMNVQQMNLASSYGGTGTLTVASHGTFTSTALNVGYLGNATVSITGGGRVATSGAYDFIATTGGQNVTATVTVSGAGSTWSSAGQLNVGGGGAATLSIGSGATLSVGGGLNLNSNYNTSGTLTLSGGARFIGSGSYNQIGNYGTVGQAVIVTVDGAGTNWSETGQLNVNAGSLTVSNTASIATVGLNIGQPSASNGVLKILSGSRVSSTGTTDSLTSNAGGIGLLLIDGAGSVFSGSGNFSLGAGSGTLTLSNGGSMQVGSFGAAYPSQGIGLVQVLAGSTLTASGTFDNLGGNGSASMTVDGAGAVFTDTTATFFVANGSGSGTLTVGHGGSVTVGALSLANQSGGVGVVNVGTLAALVSKASVNVGNGGVGSVIITAGGTLSSQGTFDVFGSNGGSGTLNVSGAGAVWKSAGSLNFGGFNGGFGSLLISNGGLVSVVTGFNAGQNANGYGNVSITNAGTFVDSAGTYDFFGGPSQSVGNGTVDGTGSSWSSAKTLIIGNNGTASFTASNNAVVNANSLAVGQLSGSVGTFTASSGAVVTVGTNIVVGNTAGSNGLLRVLSGGTIQVSASLQANQVLTVGGGAPSTDASGNYLQGASGTVVVSGTGSLLNLNGNAMEIGNAGSGSVIVAKGGTITTGIYDANQRPGVRLGNTSTGSGSLLVTDAGSTFFDAGNFVVARGGSALLTVTNHGLLNVTTDTLGVGGIGIGNPNSSGTNIGGQGVAYVTNSGTVLDSTGFGVGVNGGNGVLYVNSQGSISVGTTMGIGRSLTIAATGTVPATLDPASGLVNVGAGGTISILGNGITAAGTSVLVVGNSLQATGVLNVSGAGALVTTNGHQIVIGNNGGVGTVNVTQAGTVLAGTQFSTDSAILVGNNGGTGALVVSDAGSTFTAVGGLNIGQSGTGTLTGAASVLVENHGTLNTGNSTVGVNQGVTLGRNAATTGVLTVTGSGSILTNLGRFSVGGTSYFNAQAGGLGTVNITAGGVVNTALPAGYINGVSSTNLNGFIPAAAAEIGASSGSDGSSVSVIGTGAQWNIAGALYVAEGGSGALSVDAGGLVTAGDADFGTIAGKTATVTATGTGSAITIAGGLTVGDGGNADLVISNGATISATDAVVGFSPGGTGNIDIEGPGSRLAIADGLSIGGAGAGTGVVTVGLGATVTVTHALTVGTGSVLNVFGTVSPNTTTVSGVMNLGNGGVASFGTLALADSGQIIATGGAATLDVDVIQSTGTAGGTIEIGAGAQLTLSGDTMAGPSFTGTATPSIVFADSTGALTVTDLAALANVQIKGFVAGDQIGVGAFGSDSFSGNTLSLFSDANRVNLIGTLSFAGSVASAAVLAGVVATISVKPVISGTVGGQAVVAGGTIAPFAHVTLTDANAGATETVTITPGAIGQGTLTNLGGFVFNPATGAYTDTGTAAAVTTALEALVFNTTTATTSGQSVTTIFTITDTSSAGTSVTDSTTSVIATTVPPPPVITGISPDTGVSATDRVTASNQITVSGTGEANDTVALSLNGTVLQTVTTNAAGVWSANLAALSLGDGTYSLTAVSTDSAGLHSAASSTVSVTIDTSAATLATPLATPGGDYFIGNAAALLAASRPIAAPAGLFNTLVIQGDGTITDAGFAGISHVTGLTLNGTGNESVTLGANAAAMTGGFIAMSVPNAANYTINDGGAGAPPLYLLGGSGNATVTGSNAGDYLVFNGGTLHITEGSGDDYINIAANQLNLAGTTINGGGGYNRLVMAGGNTLTDSSFAGVSNIQELDFSGTGAQSVILGTNAHAAFGASLTIYTTTASSMTIDASGLGATGVTVTGSSGADTLIAGTGGSYFTGGTGADVFKVGLGGTNYITDFLPGLDKITLQAGNFSTFAQVTAATAQYGSSGFDINVGNGAHVVVLGVAYTSMHAADFGLTA